MIRPPRHLGIVGNRGKEGVRALLPPLIRWIRSKGRAVSLERGLARGIRGVGTGVSLETLVRRTDAVLVLGGDGTMLGAARAASRAGVPILGVNLGGLGFLTETGQEDLYPALERLFAGDVTLEPRAMVEARVRRAGPAGRARRGSRSTWQEVGLNDAVIHPSERSRVIAMDLTIGAKDIGTLVGDGLIVASPTGSTAYSLSAGGPIMAPNSGVFVITPICPHVLTNRSVIVSERSEIEVEASEPDYPVYLTVDGREPLRLETGSAVHIRKTGEPLPLAVLPEMSFFSVVRQKLKWSGSNI